jgi:hypothetical protein
MPNSVKSHLIFCSKRFTADYLCQHFSWHVLEPATPPDEHSLVHITAFDLGVGEHERVGDHLEAVKHVLLAHEKELEALMGDCKYALLVYYEFSGDGTFSVPPSVHATLAMFHVEVIFHPKYIL